MENITCGICGRLESEEDHQYCPVLDKRIFVVNLSYRDPLCTDEKVEKYSRRFAIERIRSEGYKFTRNLRGIHIALGAPNDWAFHEKIRQQKQYSEKWSVWRNLDGSYRSKASMSLELRHLYTKKVKEFHPDLNPYSESVYYIEETRKYRAIYERGLDIISRHFKKWR